MDKFLTELEVSKQLDITPSALRTRRREGNPPAFIKKEGRVLYAQSAIDDYKRQSQRNLYDSFVKYFKQFNTGEWEHPKGFLKEYVDLLRMRSGVQNPIFLVPTALTTLQYGARNIENCRPNLWTILGDKSGDGAAIRHLLEVNHSIAESLGINAVLSHFHNEKTLNTYLQKHPNSLSIELDSKKMIKHLRGYNRYGFIISMEALMCGAEFSGKASMARLRCFDQQDIRLFYNLEYSRCDAKHNYLCIDDPIIREPQFVETPKKFKEDFDQLRDAFPKEYPWGPNTEFLFKDIQIRFKKFVYQHLNMRLIKNGGGRVDTHTFLEFSFEKALRIALIHSIFGQDEPTQIFSEESLRWAISLMCAHLQTVFSLEDQFGER